VVVEAMEKVTALMKGTIRRRNSRVNQTGVEKDVVEEEVAGQSIPISSATNVTIMVITRGIATPTNVIVAVKWGILQNIVELRWKKQLTWPWKMKMKVLAQNEDNINNDTLWYLDSGASNHMCGHEYLFKKMQKIEDGHVSFGDASKVEVKGQGTVCYLQKDGLIGSIQDVYYVPNLKTNILSLGQLTEKGYSILIKDRVLHLKDKQGRLVAQVEMGRNRMYKLNLRCVREKCLQVNVEDKSTLWHLRFGHLHHGGLKKLAKKNMVHGLPDMDYEGKFCEECVFGKQTRTSFQKKADYRTKHILELIHTDICGPITPESFSGKRYFISFISR
jgi:hypothetical protein